MGRTRLAQATAVELARRISFAEKKKKELILYSQKLKEKYSNKEISYSRYIEILYKKTDDKTIKQWIDHYTSYIKECEKELKKQKRTLVTTKVSTTFFSLIIIILLIASLIYVRPIIQGFFIQEQEFTEQLNLDFNNSTTYEWQIQNPGQLDSLKISGSLKNTGKIKIYLDDLLILDSKNIKQTSSALTGQVVEEIKTNDLPFWKKILGLFGLVGRAIEETPEESSDSSDSSSDTNQGGDSNEDSSPSPDSETSSQDRPSDELGEESSPDSETQDNSNSEEINKEAPGDEEDSSPSQDPAELPSETSNSDTNQGGDSNEDSSPSQESSPDSETPEEDTETNETEIKEPEIPEENVTEIPETNITEEPDINITDTETNKTAIEEPEEGPKTITFEDICEETCDLSEFGLNKTAYTLRIEITNSELTIEEIKYLLTEEIGEIPTNITNITKPETRTNITEPETNLTGNITLLTNITTLQYKAIINKPTKWIKTIKIEDPEKTNNLSIELPKEAENISIKTGREIQESLDEKEIYDETIEKTKRKNFLSGALTGNVAKDIKKEQGIFTRLFGWIKNIGVTGNIIGEEEIESEITETTESKIIDLKKIVTQTQAKEIAIEYYTDGPVATEEDTKLGKRVIVSGKDELNYTDVLTFAEIPEKFGISQENKIRVYWKEEQKYIDFTAYDLDSNNLIDYVEFITPHLSNQTFEIILIIKAEYLDSNRIFISDIYDEVKTLDNIWSETIQENNYVRIKFETNLTSERDITIYPKTINGTPKIEIYEINGTEVIAEFSSINNNEYNKVFLTNLQGSQDTFDLKILNGEVQFDHIIDPSACAGGTCTFNDSYILADIGLCEVEGFRGGCGFGDEGVQIKWDISDLCDLAPGSIDSAKLQLYISSKMSTPDDDSTILYVDDQNWDESTIDTSIEAQSTSNSTGGTLSSTTSGTLTNISVQTAVQQACSQGDNLTIRFYDTDYTVSPINEVYDTTTYFHGLNSLRGGGGYTFVSREGATQAQRPVLTVSYTAGGSDLAPTVLLNAPPHNTANKSTSFTFQCNVTDGQNISNTTLYIWNSTNDVWNSTLNTSTGTSQNYSVEVSNLPIDDYVWNCLAYDNASQSSWATSNFSLNVTSAQEPELNLLSPPDEFQTQDLENTFVCNVSGSAGITNVSLWANWSGFWHQVQINSSGLNYTNYTFTQNIEQDYVNQTDGFNVGVAGIVSPSDIATNGSDFWAIDYWDRFISHFNATGQNQTDGIDASTAGATQITSITTNGSDFWVTDDADDFVYHLDAAGNNKSDGFDIGAIGATDVYALTTNGSDFWILDGLDKFVYHLDAAGNNITDGFDVSLSGTTTPKGITTNGSDFWVMSYQDDFVLHFNSSGQNQTDGFSTTGFGGEDIAGIVTDVELTGGTPNNFWITDLTDDFTYHLKSTTIGSYDWSCQACNTLGNCNTTVANRTIEIIGTNLAPTIPYVEIISPTAPTEGTSKAIEFTVTVDDQDGVSDINDASIQANFTRTGQSPRVNSSCLQIAGENTSTSQNYSCTIDIWYWDQAGTWDIGIYAEDSIGAEAINNTEDFQINILKAIIASPSEIDFGSISIGAKNQTANQFILINNTGNFEGDGDDVWIVAKNLYYSGNIFSAGNFTADIDSGGAQCDGTALSGEASAPIAGSDITAGNLSAGGIAQEEIYLCIPEVPSLPSGTYTTDQEGSWTIVFALVAMSFRRKKKKKKLRKALDLLSEDLKEEYTEEKHTVIKLLIKEVKKKHKLTSKEISELVEIKPASIPLSIFANRMGALESISKYMRENLGMSYSEIAKLLRRDERTIWTAHHKANQKQPKSIEVKSNDMKLPVSIFENDKLTILETLITYLRQKEMKYVEIANLLERDQRNVWSIYSRVLKKPQVDLVIEIDFIKPRKKKKKLRKALDLLSEDLKEEYTEEKHTVIKLLIKEVKKKHKLTSKEISELVEIKPASIPLSIFANRMGALESISKYMRENLGMSYSEIAKLLRRDERTIWTAHHKANQKQPKSIEVKSNDMKLPVSIFENDKLTILETLITYLRQKEMKYVEIANLLERDQRNVWSIYSRVLKKRL